MLEEFFTLTDRGWIHGRIEHELEQYQAKAKIARVNGSKGGRPKKPRKTQPVVLANPDVTQTKANHKPLTINHKPVKELCDATAPPAKAKRKTFIPPTPDQVAEYLREQGNVTINPSHFCDFYATRGWKLSSGTKMANWKAAVRTWINREEKNSAITQPAGQKQTASQRQREALQRLEGTQQSDAKTVDSDDRNVWAQVDIINGGGAQRHMD